MKHRSDFTTQLLISVAVAVLLHVGLWLLADKIRVRAFYAALTDGPDNRRVQVEAIDLRDILRRRPKPRQPLRQRLLEEQQKALRELFEKEKLNRQPVRVLKPELTGLGRDILRPQRRQAPRLTTPQTSPPPKILAISGKDLSLDRLLLDRPRIAAIPRQQLAGRLVPAVVSRAASGGRPYIGERVPLGMRLRLPPRPAAAVALPTSPLDLPRLEPDRAGVLDEGNKVRDLDRLLKVDVKVFREPDGGGFFQVDIQPNEAGAAIPAMAKDVLFLVDSSASITTRKLRRFQQGLDRALDDLGAADRFNVVRFRDVPQPLFSAFAPPTEANLAAAREFLHKLRAGGKTDVYAGLSPYLTYAPDSDRPYLIFLISDGRTTTGEELANNEFLRRIAHDNRAHASIFSFSCGEETNLFLMNFIAYKNRGIPVHQRAITSADRKLREQIGDFAELLVADLECRVAGDLQADVYPKSLPHLFRGYPLTVYGRFAAGDDELAIQVTGRDYRNQRQELVIHQKLSDAPAGTADVTLNWAAQKLVDLVGRQSVSPTPERHAAIKALAERYHIVLPYAEY